MRCNPLRWLWGLLPLGMLIWLAVVIEEQPIEQDLHQRTQAALAQAGFTWAGTGFDGRDGLVKGIAFQEEHPGQASKIVKNVWGVRVVEADVDLIDLVETYAWSARTTADKITLEGFVPNHEVRNAIHARVKKRFPKFEIDDRMKHARGAPDTKIWLNGIDFGLDRLTQLKAGSLELSSLDMSIDGEARDYSNFKSAKAALEGAMPDGVRLARDNIRPPLISPYLWKSDRTTSQLVLSGHVPSEEIRERIFATAKKTYPSLVIIDRMETGAGAPGAWETTVISTLGQLARLQTGAAELVDTRLKLIGEAPDADTANAVITELKDGLPQDYEFRPSLTFPEPTPPVVSPFTTAIEATPESIRLTGFVPDEETRTQVIEATKKAFPEIAITDEIALGSGQPEGWKRCLLAGLDAVKKLGAGTVDVSDKQLKVSGTTSNEALADAIPGEVRAATTRACEATVEIDLDLPSEPYLTWTARHDGKDNLVLDGQVPDIETLTLLLEAARNKFPNANVDNRMKIASGYSAKWQKVATTGLNLLSLLRSGEASLFGQSLVIRGIASDTAAATAIKDRLAHNLEKHYSGSQYVEVKSDAMIWAEEEAKRKAQAEEIRRREAELEAARQKTEEEAAERLRVEAEQAARLKAAADEEARRNAQAEEDARLKAEEAARREAEAQEAARLKAQADEQARLKAQAEAEAAERQRVEAQKAAEREKAAEIEAARLRAAQVEAELAARRKAEAEEAARLKAAQEAQKIQEAEAKEAARLKAQAEEKARRDAQAAAAAALADEALRKADAAKATDAARRHHEARQQVLTPEQKRVAYNCQQRMRDVAKQGIILFEYAEATLSQKSHATLDRLAEVAKSCPDVDLDVEGHTDSIGQRPDNRSLSLQRANAVIDYLIKAGVSRSRLHPVGYGEDKPVAPNNSSSNRAKNRRIEFSVSRNG